MLTHSRLSLLTALTLITLHTSQAYAQTAANPAAIGADLARDINTTIMQEMSANEKAALS